MRWTSESGQAATENLAVISVLVIAIVAATYTFVPTFSSGVDELAHDASNILATGQINGAGAARGSNGGITTSGMGTSGSELSEEDTGTDGSGTSTPGGGNGGPAGSSGNASNGSNGSNGGPTGLGN